jgi:hypothetical protein
LEYFEKAIYDPFERRSIFVESYSREFALFIDGIRVEKGITRIDFIEDIVSLSQYKRYLKGAAAIPNNVVIMLADKLKYNITDLYSIYTKKYSKEEHQLNNVYKLIQNYSYNEAFKELQKVNSELIVSQYYKMTYDFLMIYTQYKLGMVSDVHVLNLYTDLIDYPQCLNNESFNFIELSVLLNIVLVSSSMDNFNPVNQIYEVFVKRKFSYSSTDDKSIVPVIYYNIARAFYRQEDYSKTIETAKIGVSEATSNENTNALPQLYLLIANSEYYSNNELESLKMFKKSIYLLAVLNKQSQVSSFIKYYVNNNVDIELIVSEILENLK